MVLSTWEQILLDTNNHKAVVINKIFSQIKVKTFTA